MKKKSNLEEALDLLKRSLECIQDLNTNEKKRLQIDLLDFLKRVEN